MRAVIFANGIIKHLPEPEAVIMPDDLLIAADGGAHHCEAMGITPSVIAGDFDSLDPDELNKLQSSGVEIIQYPARKDQTDLELALELAVDRGADGIIVFGALGARWDMSIANILLLTLPKFSGVKLKFIEENQEITLLRSGEEFTLNGKKGDILSLTALDQKVKGVTLSGLEYPLKNSTLQLGSTRGISNVMVENTATIYLKNGLLLCVHTHIK
ncbi:MAG: thiamine diphosphokinase [Deltaproteobacteria bacterium]|nr:thiamine diphosphokinase [Deltaproteobacteria bacterium]MBW2661239.1 thiamine diphosphokinase [Deltaproteobacteria bacterium]